MAPGVQHCSGGDGPDSIDTLSAIEKWVEQGVAPDRITASKFVAGKVTRTRPLCAYPQVAKYSGAGSIDDAANFACANP
jgi:feruloyl esterase